ncbi:hypothetical protein TR74_11850 [Carbonactinospora thermoautotrophica]|uniref:Uncharacterized protein n=1 Tax=Carbonactinospora thermoautotrophica TaxID=1469144 RepID=A0A132MTF5_9ACTN|nr:hypothetical protein LI90_2054 [Carbonactinospora thermoautotrophica]KWX09070.1 hypothetical protein TR74_11850 [Carbonactinospora thermoautotrophica]
MPSLFGLESAQAQLLSDKQVWALVDAGKHLSKAQAMLRARRVPKARKQAREAWKLTEPVVQKLRASRKRQQALVAERLIKPFTKLARQGVDVWVGRSGRDGTCPVCQLELSAADIAGRRLRHVECE